MRMLRMQLAQEILEIQRNKKKKKEKKEKEQSPSFVPFKITEHYNHSTDIEYLNHDLLREGSAKLWQHLQELARSGKLDTILVDI